MAVLCLAITQASIMPLISSAKTTTIDPKRQLTLYVEYACMDDTDFKSCAGEIQWNGESIFSFKPQNYEINKKSLIVTANAGRNTISFLGAGA